MKIAFLTDGIHPYMIGGMQKYAFNLTKNLAAKGHEVYLFHCNNSGYDSNKLEFFTENEKKHIHSFVIPFPHLAGVPLHYLYESWLYSKAIDKRFQEAGLSPDLILAQGFCGWYMLVHGKNKDVPLAVHLHGFEMFQQIPSVRNAASSLFLKMAARKNLALADYAISFGGRTTDILSQIVNKEKIWEIPGGIDEKWLQTEVSQNSALPSDGEELRFIFVGRYERRKGIEELNKAVKHSMARFRVEFVGDIPESKRMKAPGITYYGQIADETEMQKLVKRCDVLVCPSWSEGMPTVIMEAMACGLAIIATDVGAVSQLVSHENGWLLPSPEPSLIANAMNEAMTLGNEKLKEKKVNSLRKIKNFTMGAAAEMLVQKIT